MNQWATSRKRTTGFTIVELLIVIVVIAILAAITIVAYNGIQDNARMSKMKSDLATLSKAVRIARENTSKTFYAISGSSYSASGCASKIAGTDLAALDIATDTCWTRYNSTLTAISNASGVNVTGLVDPYGRPYFIDENEGEGGTSCSMDRISAYTMPANGSTRIVSIDIAIPLSGFSGCS